MKKILVGFLLFTNTLSAQPNVHYASANVFLGIHKLKTLGSVLYIAAHPDDENTALITYLSKERKYRTAYLSLTRGDGGQNLIGDEQGVELGLIRTQELLAARKIDGGTQFFSRAFDFGYSKTPEETFNKWDKNKILSDVVWIIRKFQPDIIITRFPTTGEGGHGHHTASAILANEAFKLAADPTIFPEQLRWVKPWQAKRILFNSFRFGNVNTTNGSQLQLDIGAYNPILGKSYGEIAAESRSQHKSQGFGATLRRGEMVEYFSTTGGDVAKSDIMDGVITSWQRVPNSTAILQLIDNLIEQFNFAKPENSIADLVQLYQSINALPDGFWKQIKLDEITQLIKECSGLYIDALSENAQVVNGDSLKIKININNRLAKNLVVKKISVKGDVSKDTLCNIDLAPNKNYLIKMAVALPLNGKTSQPYWLQSPKNEGYFQVNNQQLIGEPDAITPYFVELQLNVDNESFTFTQPVQYKFTDPVQGELYQPLVVLPPILVQPTQPLKIVAPKEVIKGTVLLKSLNNSQSYKVPSSVFPSLVKNLQLKNAIGSIKNKENPSEMMYQFLSSESEKFTINAFIDHVKEGYSQDLKNIYHTHIPAIHYFIPSTIQITQADIKHKNKTIGYIVGAGDKVPEALEMVGYQVTIISQKDLTNTNLSQFDAIITGVRAFNTNEWLSQYHNKLMQYVKDGGNVIVQYNTASNAGPIKQKIGPYDFTISRNRVTNEQAKVDFLLPNHPVLNIPNKITQKDFEGWIQERSIYHASGFDASQYAAPLAMADKNEAADNGSLIIAQYGSGYFTYTGLVFFRELPAGVPGAYRLLANLIDLNVKEK